MKTIKEGARIASTNAGYQPKIAADEVGRTVYECGFKRGCEFVQHWISIVDELPECKHIDETDDKFSDYVLVKIMGYEHPFVAFYCKIGTNEGFDLVHLSVDEITDKKAITHWRPIERT